MKFEIDIVFGKVWEALEQPLQMISKMLEYLLQFIFRRSILWRRLIIKLKM